MNNKIRLVLVEDHKLLCVGLKSLFEKHGEIVVVGEAENGKSGIEKIKSQKPDVAIIDIGLPDISGIEVLKEITNEMPDVKTIILTSHMKENEILECLKYGANAYVLKDIADEMLVSIVKSVKDGAMWLDPKVVDIVRNSSCGIMPAKTTSRASFKAQHANLTEREYEVLKLLVDGKSNSQIAEILSISEHTSKAHVCNIIQKLVVDDRTQAAVKAIREGLV